MTFVPRGRALAAVAIAVVVGLSAAVPIVLAHEERQVAGYDIEIGLIGEPVYVGDRSGLELFVHKGDQPVMGLEKTLKTAVAYGDRSIELPLSAREGDAGAYESVFIPTAAGPYTFHVSGMIDATAIDETFTSSPSGFGEVQDAASGQFPVQLPSIVDLSAQAEKGADAAGRQPLALGLGVAGVILGLVALGVALASRRSGSGDEVGTETARNPGEAGAAPGSRRRRS